MLDNWMIARRVRFRFSRRGGDGNPNGRNESPIFLAASDDSKGAPRGNHPRFRAPSDTPDPRFQARSALAAEG